MKFPSMNAKRFLAFLTDVGMCSEAREWAKGKSLTTVLRTCKRADWLLRILWLLARQAGRSGWPSLQQVVLITCAAIEPAMRHVPAGRLHPQKAIAAARRWAHNPTKINRRLMNRAAWATTRMEGNMAARSAAWAAWAVGNFTVEEAARWAAQAALTATRSVVAEKAEHQQMCRIIRWELAEQIRK